MGIRKEYVIRIVTCLIELRAVKESVRIIVRGLIELGVPRNLFVRIA